MRTYWQYGPTTHTVTHSVLAVGTSHILARVVRLNFRADLRPTLKPSSSIYGFTSADIIHPCQKRLVTEEQLAQALQESALQLSEISYAN